MTNPKDEPYYQLVNGVIEQAVNRLLEIGSARDMTDTLQAVSSCLTYYAFQCLLAVAGGDVAGALHIQTEGIKVIAEHHEGVPAGTTLQ